MRHPLLGMIVLATLANSSHAATVNNSQGAGGNVVLRRGSASEPVPADTGEFLRIKFQSGTAENNNTDRLGLLKFDLTSLPAEPITVASLRIHLPRGASSGQPNNRFDAGETLYLYGVPNGAAGEDFSLDPLQTLFVDNPYVTGTGSVSNPRPAIDLTANGVNDDLLPLLATYTFANNSDAGDFVNFHSNELTSFLQADSNKIATFMLTMRTIQDFAKTPVISAALALDANHRPTLRTNTNVTNTDFNNSGGTTIDDFNILKSNFLSGTTLAQGDANFDGKVDHADFYLWRTVFVTAGGSLEGLSLSIPEPSSAALAGLFGLAACSTRLVRRRSR